MRLRQSVHDQAFDQATFDRLRADLAAGALTEPERLSSAPTALSASDHAVLQPLPADAKAREALRKRGESAICAGRVASVVLNGGMATRFGGGAKGVVPVVAGESESFLSIKLRQCSQTAQRLAGRLPVVVMNSFATRAASLTHLANVDWAGVPRRDRLTFDQSIMPRLCPDGTALVEAHPELADGDVYAAPGHGDTLGRIRESGMLDALRERGVEHVLVSNVDNLGATVDPVVLGAVLDADAQVCVEVVRRRDGDAGGCVAAIDGRPMIIEAFRLPAGLDISSYPHFNTNTLWFSLDALDRDYPLTWFPVRKQVPVANGQKLEVVQLERLIGQVTEFATSSYIEVDRDVRFVPVKTRHDLVSLEPQMRELIASLRG